MIDGPCDRNVRVTITSDVVVGAETLYLFRWAQPSNTWTPSWKIIGSYFRLAGQPSTVGIDRYTNATFQVLGLGTSVAGTNALVGRFIPDGIVNSYQTDASELLMSVNPVVMKVQTSNLPGTSEASGMLLGKEVSSAGVLLSGCQLSGAINTSSWPHFGRWYLNLYESDDTDSAAQSVPQNPSKTTAVISLRDGPSAIHSAFSARLLAPHQSVEFVANAVGLDFRLLAMNVRGRILETERNKNSYV
jgi:hypothetical protein